MRVGKMREDYRREPRTVLIHSLLVAPLHARLGGDVRCRRLFRAPSKDSFSGNRGMAPGPIRLLLVEPDHRSRLCRLISTAGSSPSSPALPASALPSARRL